MYEELKMKIDKYYQILNNNDLTSLDNDIYFDYQGEGYNKIDFQKINPLAEAKDITSIIKYSDEDYYFHFYYFTSNDKLYKGMDLIILEKQIIKDHYLIIQEVTNKDELMLKSQRKTCICAKLTKDFLVRFWEGKPVDYAKNYLEHSSFTTEIEYQRIIEFHVVNNFIVMLCDAKIDGIYGTIADLYCVENEEFVEHWDCFTPDLNQPPEY